MDSRETSIDRIAELAQIALTEEEVDIFSKQVRDILSFFEVMDGVNTDGVKPTSHVLDIVNVFRSDSVKQSYPVEDILRNAPESQDGYFKMPPILDDVI